MEASEIAGTHIVKLENSKNRKDKTVTLNIKFQKVTLIVPVDKKKDYSNVSVTIIDAIEKNCANGEERIFWRLITNLAVNIILPWPLNVEIYSRRC